MTQLSPTALEAAAKAVEAAEFGYHLKLTSLIDGVSTYTLTYSDMSEPLIFSDTDTAYLHIADRKREVQTTAAITAYLAQMEKEGFVMVPTNATAQMIAAAFPSTDRDVLSSEDLKTGAAAIMILEGPADLGAITGPAVKEAAAMCKDYRAMLAAAQNGGE